MPNPNTLIISQAALGALVVLQITMLAALFSGTPPHPPLVIVPFALGPFLGASIAVAIAAMVLQFIPSRLASVSAVVAVALALVSLGPQKWIDPNISQIWPAILVGQFAAVTLIISAFKHKNRSS